MPPEDDNQRAVFNPNWLFATIVGILLFHYVFLGVSLSVCIWGLRLNFLRLIETEAPVTLERLKEDRASLELQGLCKDIDDQFRNARNKAIEIILALLVPTSTVIGSYMKKKRDDAQPPDVDPTAGQP